MPEVIKFYLKRDPYGFLSNFWIHEQIVNEIHYHTNEHYYQSMRAKDPKMKYWIKEAPTAWAAMMAGRSLRPEETSNGWERGKIYVMLVGLRAKFTTKSNWKNPLVDKLLKTGDAILIEDSPTDMFWGGRLAGSQNMLGSLLMKVREKLRKK